MKKGQVYEGIVEQVSFPNKAVVRTDEGSILVKGVLPGQRVLVFVNKVRHGQAEGIVREILAKASNECEAACPHAGSCGGCSYQTLPYADQLALKEKQIREIMQNVPNFEKIFEGIKESPRKQAYRNKMEFSFGDECKGGELALGMHKKGSFYDIVTVDQCQIVDEDYRKILSCVLNFMKAHGYPFLHKMSHEGYLRHLLVRKAAYTGEILIAFVTTTQEEHGRELEELSEELKGLALDGTITGILHTVNDSLADVVQNDGTTVLYGKDSIMEELLGMKFRISEFSFFQTNSLGAEVLYETARDFIGDVTTKDGKMPILYDLYSGTGTIAQMMAPVAKKVIGVEIVEEAVEAAKENALLNGLHNCEFIAGDVLKELDNIEEKPDYIILDPPRDGIHPKALQKIIDYGVDKMVYISCKPTSLARDLEVLCAQGYEPTRMCCVDMFPGTSHVETCCLLVREQI